jgi:hypothetical protein
MRLEVINLPDQNYSEMKILKLFSLLVVLTFLFSSCFLFRKKHERCPAYGSDKGAQEQIDVPLKVDDDGSLTKSV